MTGLLNAIIVYAVAYHVQLRLTKLGPHMRERHSGEGNVLDGALPRVDTHMAEDDDSRRRRHCRHPTRPTPAFMFSSRVGGGDDPTTTCEVSADRDSFTRLDRFRKHISDVSTLCTLSGYTSDSNGPNIAYGEGESDPGRPEDALRTLESGTGVSSPEPTALPPRGSKLANVVSTWAKQNIFLALSILLFLFPGLLLSSMHVTDFPLDVGFLFTMWLIFTSAQSRVKQYLVHHHRRRSPGGRPQHRKALTAIATLLNPVLWTSLALLCYGLAKAHIRAVPAATIVAHFKTGNAVSDLIAHHLTTTTTTTNTTPSTPLFGAGDLATSILNAGIVSWGLKLFEYRAPLLSRGGVTVLLTSASVAALNVVAWPLLASRALGVRPAASALSFAARSVTIALGGPALVGLGGDVGVNAVGVVVNGIIFQLVAGCFVGERGGFEGRMQWLRGQVGRLSWWWRCWSCAGTSGDVVSPEDPEKAQYAQQTLREQGGCRRHHHQHQHVRYSSDATHLDDEDDRRRAALPSPLHTDGAVVVVIVISDDVHTVAAGVTIGINAAAMGTAHLYEQASHAAPYSALAMTLFGIFTVLFTVPSPMVVWLRGMVGV